VRAGADGGPFARGRPRCSFGTARRGHGSFRPGPAGAQVAHAPGLVGFGFWEQVEEQSHCGRASARYQVRPVRLGMRAAPGQPNAVRGPRGLRAVAGLLLVRPGLDAADDACGP